ncbi:SDR family NAD(P)-dependent oxidoreductase [Caldimonas thermodepolymerans]|uniref:Daunorubicin C-13 ketoreductase n=2 Tax=Caldimonas thermodepolymerans TaxID=215580 RepID=A0A2S5T544_9BURK|nr:SDR family NAD(P)-dependent oxidoreductase [Caldimonas thermodepolymerans]PPE70103.1 daunorubicin C-13 ketoreductase [Caldimonas thermodepolymerans]QPC31623.1 SDR family NAD(P)-dependent oxidoreductase [Caldimonas thermodepolymerans]RDH94786.1 NAD(P)-dependent dehydrogenase (short-subunit alcohol dehydrogenase family) [Caldimonas thermodepolymerans]TCP02436.1 NAD(P)-dependent dehydrogenase (short-subunit alcohol dehydrogenase family) [Caldimonas thermodepolymerans]
MDRRSFLFASATLGAGSLWPAGAARAQSPASRSTPMGATNPRPERPARKRVFITGSSTGLGYLAAETLLSQGHEVVVHVRSRERMSAVQPLLERGAAVTVGDLSDLRQARDLARQVNELGRMDAVIHNAGVLSGPQVLVVNTVAPYLLTALVRRPQRLIYLSSALHRSGSTDLAGMDWTGRRATGSYADSKLYVTTLAAAVARRWPDVCSNAVNPGWVPTRMGGPAAPDDLRQGHATQEWLAVSDDPEALTSGGYWYHLQREEPHPAVHDVRFQDQLLAALERATGTPLA